MLLHCFCYVLLCIFYAWLCFAMFLRQDRRDEAGRTGQEGQTDGPGATGFCYVFAIGQEGRGRTDGTGGTDGRAGSDGLSAVYFDRRALQVAPGICP